MPAFIQETRVTVTRNGVPVAGLGTVPVRFKYMSNQEASELGGAQPYDSYWMSTMSGTPDIRRRDLLIDQVNIDPVTGKFAVYRVFGNPHFFDTSYVRVAVEKAVGTQPGLGG